MLLESVNEDTIQELLKDSRATSRASSRPMQRAQLQQTPPPPKTPITRPKDTNILYQNGDTPDISVQPKKSFLPEIDPKGNLVHRPDSQRLNNEDYPGSRQASSLSSAVLVRNSLSSTSNVSLRSEDSFAQNGQTPRPPSSERKSSGGRNRSAVVKNSFD